MPIYSKYKTKTYTLLGKLAKPANITFKTPVIEAGTGGITVSWNEITTTAAACSDTQYTNEFACLGGAGSCTNSSINNRDECVYEGETWVSNNTWTEYNNSLDFKEYVVQQADSFVNPVWDDSNNIEVYRGRALEFLFTATQSDWAGIATDTGVKFLIKAIDTTGNYSADADSCTMSIGDSDVSRFYPTARIYRQTTAPVASDGMNEGDIWFDTDSSPINRQYVYTGSGSGWESAEGSAGLNTATVALYRKSTDGSTAPDAFSGNFTYTFATGTVTGGTLNSWTATVPAVAPG